jgi:hypothetical protein
MIGMVRQAEAVDGQRNDGSPTPLAAAQGLRLCASRCLFRDNLHAEPDLSVRPSGRETMQLNDGGRMLAALWAAIPARSPDVELDAFRGDAQPSARRHRGAGHDHNDRCHDRDGVGAFKSTATVTYIRGVKSIALPAFRMRL